MNAFAAILAFLVVVPLILVPLFRVSAPQAQPRGAYSLRRPLSPTEQTMYWRLAQVFPAPDFVVLAQVSFGALVSGVGLARVSDYQHRRADFVVLDRSFRVLAVIEFSERAKRDNSKAGQILQRAGHKVLQYRGVPEKERLQKDILH